MSTPTAIVITQRQAEVIRLIARGYSTEEIAAELKIAVRTSKSHSDTLRWKLGVKTRREIPMAYMNLTGDDPYPHSEKVPNA